MKMSDPKLISSLKETLSAVKSASDGAPGWQVIILLYENTIEKAERGEPFSVQDAPRIYLEFSSSHTSDIFKLLEQTAVKMQYSGTEAKCNGLNPHCIINGKAQCKRIFVRKKAGA